MRTTSHIVLLPILACLSAGGPSQSVAAEHTMSVSGSGTVSAKPDMADADFAVVTESKTAGDALQQNNQAVEQLFSTLEQHEIPQKDVQTTSFDVSPKYVYHRNSDEPPQIVGYTVTNQVHVHVHDLSRLGELLDAAVGAGANRVQGIRFSVSQRDRLLDRARREAVQQARHTAQVLAEAAGVKLGPVIGISENPHSRPPRPVSMREAAAAEGVPVAPGRQAIEVDVTLTFELLETEGPRGTETKKQRDRETER